MKKKTDIVIKLLISILFLIYAYLLNASSMHCLILQLSGIRCLGCGMTRALISALHLDFKAAFSYHFMFWSVPLLYLCFWLDGKLFKNKKANLAFYALILVGFFANWIYHIFF